MKYMMMIYSSKLEQTPEEWQADIAAYAAFGKEIADHDYIGEALQPVSTATTVKVRDGETITTDGPFIESHEQLGGFYVIDCEDLDEALALAAKIPDAKNGTIEVRPLVVFD